MTFLNVILAIGIPSIVVALIHIGMKLQVLDSLEKTFAGLNASVNDIKERFIVVEDRMKIVWNDELVPAHSPRQLNERGNSILNGSGIKEVIESRKDEFLKLIKAKDFKNPYDAELYTLQVIEDLKKDEALVEKLKPGAFSVGADIGSVLLVGGYHLRNLIFPELGFSLTDLDKPKAV